MSASRPEQRDAPTIDRRYEGMLENQRQALVDETKRLQAQLDAESDIQDAQRQEIASLGLVNKELADALETVHLRMDRWAVGDVQPGRKGKDSDLPVLRRRIEAALRAAGRMS